MTTENMSITRHYELAEDEPSIDVESLVDLCEPSDVTAMEPNGKPIRHKYDPQRHRRAVFRLGGSTVKVELPAFLHDDDRLKLLRAVNALCRQGHSADG